MESGIIFIGPVGAGKKSDGGSIIKNQILTERLKTLTDIKIVDTTFWKKDVKVAAKLLYNILRYPHYNIIISSSYKSAYTFIKILTHIVKKDRIFYWVIGGALPENIIKDKLNLNYYKKVNKIIVEGKKMQADLMKQGLSNVIYIPNLKRIDYLPVITRENKDMTRFVFLSRIIRLKGCDLIFDSCERLNAEGFEKKYNVTFYGPIDSSYETHFKDRIAKLANVSYNGFLNLKESTGYDELAQYDCMLFPTFWPTEGFPGIIIDAFIAGLPVICTDWNMNSELILDKENGFVIESIDDESLTACMRSFIQNKDDYSYIIKNNQDKVHDYNVNEIVTSDLLTSLGMNIKTPSNKKC